MSESEAIFQRALKALKKYQDTDKHEYVGHELNDEGVYEIAVKVYSLTKYPLWPAESLKINGKECIDDYGNKGAYMNHYQKPLERFFNLSNAVNLSNRWISLDNPAEVVAYNIIKYQPGLVAVYMFAN